MADAMDVEMLGAPPEVWIEEERMRQRGGAWSPWKPDPHAQHEMSEPEPTVNKGKNVQWRHARYVREDAIEQVRERCARVCDEVAKLSSEWSIQAEQCANTIRTLDLSKIGGDRDC